MKIKHLLSTIIIASLALIPISANAVENDVQPTTVAEQNTETSLYAPPTVSTLTNKLEGVEIKWNKVESVKYYRLYRKTNNSGWSYVANINGTSYVDKNVVSGKTYAYTVRCLDENLELISSYNNGKIITYVQAPEISKIENTQTGAKITWSKCAGASKYRVFVFKNNEWNRIGTTSSTSFVHDGLKAGTTYRYTVRCLDSKGNYASGFSGQGVTNTFYAPPTMASLAVKYEGVQVKWNKTDSVENYRLYRKVNNSGWSYIGNFKGTSYVDKNVISGNTYAYTVRCLDKNNQLISSYNNGKSITFVKAPEITKIENTATGAEIFWTKSAGATKYRVFVYKNNEWSRIGTTSSTSFIHEGLKAGSSYKYTVRCVDNKDNYVSGYNNGGYTNTFYAPPQISSISKANNGTLIKWNSASGVAGYRLYRKTINSSWGILASVSGTSYIDTTAKKDTLYTYTLRYLDKNQNVISYYIEDTKYYCNGSLANGTFTIGNSKYTFNNGVFRAGLQTINGNKYYYNSSGVLQKNGIVGSDKDGYYYADKNGKIDFNYCNAITQNGYDWNVIQGKATKAKTESDKTLFRALKTVGKITDSSMTKSQKLKVCFDYVKGAYIELNPRIPHYNGNDWPIIYANDMFIDGAGNCFSYGAAFAYMAKGIGYTEVYCCHSGGHGWAEIDGLVYDPEWSKHHSTYSYYALSYDTKTDVNYKGAISANYSWMHVKI